MKNLSLIVMILFVFCSFPLNATEIFISPDGNDGNSGSRDSPLATMEMARDKIRTLVENGLQENITVIILEGNYFLTKPLILDTRDSGSDEYSIVYQGETGKKVSFIGGIEIKNFEKVNEGLWKTSVPEVSKNNWKFEQLYVNDKRAIRARTPNFGEFFNVQKVEETILTMGEGRVPDRAIQKITAHEAAIGSLHSEANLQNALITFYHNWDNTRKYVKKIDGEGIIYVEGQGMKPWNKINDKSRFFVENIRSGLDAPGEWYLEEDGSLFYIPLTGQELDKSTFYAPLISQFLILRGTGLGEEMIKNVHFKNLGFKVSGYTTPREGNEPAQAAAPIESVIMVDFGKNITFHQMDISNTGVGGIWFREANFNNKLTQSHLHDIGAGGVKIGALEISERPVQEDFISREVQIDNNIIRSGGWVFPCAVAVAIFHSSDNEVTFNEIADWRYSGVSVGWVWGYGHSYAKRNRIKFNHIHHLGWGDLSDMGGVYTLGVSEGTEVSHNVIHHVYSLTYGGWGLYTDEGSTGIIMENNLVYACKSAGFHQHYGKENQIRNNIFAYNLKSQLQATRVEEHPSFYFSNNIVIFDSGTLLSSNWEKINIHAEGNVYWNERSPEMHFGEYSWWEWQKLGRDKNSLIRDPNFRDPKGFDFEFKNKKAIRKTGFKIFDTGKAGVYGDKNWIKKAEFDPKSAAEFDEMVARNEAVNQ